MLTIDIPDFGALRLAHLVLDYNGTLACDGRLLPEVLQTLRELTPQLQLHVVTADTYGDAGRQLKDFPCQLHILQQARQNEAKREYVRQLGASNCVCIGNGRNDQMMLQDAALGIAVMQVEGCAAACLASADIVVTDILTALNLLRNPKRLLATLRS